MNPLKDFTLEKKLTLINTIAGILVGLLSGFLSIDPYQVSSGILVFMAVVFYITTGQIFQHVFDVGKKKEEDKDKEYGIKWWLSNSGMMYFGFWLLSWIFIYNKFLL